MENEERSPENQPDTTPEIEDISVEASLPTDDFVTPEDASVPAVDYEPADDLGEDAVEAAIDYDEDEPDADVEYNDTPDEASDQARDAALDIDAALAAVASLGDFLTEQEPEAEVLTSEFTAVDVAPPAEVQARSMLFPTPPPSTLPRGSMASVVPALALIGIGAWLTFAYSTGTSPDPLFIIAAVFGGVALALLARWLSAGRWARGTLFIVSTLLLCALVLVVIALTGASQLYPLLLSAVGAAFWVSAQLARPRDLRLMFPGSLLVIGGLVGAIMFSGVLSTDILNVLASVWFIPVIILAILMLLPVLRRGH